MKIDDGGMGRVWVAMVGVLLLAGVVWVGLRAVRGKKAGVAASEPAGAAAVMTVPDFHVPLGLVRAPLPYRIVSFHRGRADKDLIKLAAQLGFNGVQFQIEGSTERGLEAFAERDAKEHLVDYCHQLGMKVTVWVHEFSDLPGPWMPEYLGPETARNERLWEYLEERYERLLTEVIPNVDGLVLTVVETEVRATDPEVLVRLVDLLAKKCAEHKKTLMVRTFVWYPEEFEKVMAAVRRFPAETVIMSKAVPQDWQMRGANAQEIGDVGGRAQVVEYDACGEYFLRDTVANCMVDLLKRQFDYGVSKKVQGICVRVDRDDASVLWEPNEVNLWALGLFAGGVTDKSAEVWERWAKQRYGEAAAGGVIRALEPTSEVVAEMLSEGPFSFGDTRAFPPLPDDPDILLMNWQNWRWDRGYLPQYYRAAYGDAAFIAEVEGEKAAAMKAADECLANLEAVKGKLSPVEYMILYTKLLTNKTQMECRGPMVLATLEYQAYLRARTAKARKTWAEAMRKNLVRVRGVADSLGDWPTVVDYLGKRWYLGEPEGMEREPLYRWAWDAELCLEGKHVLPEPVKLEGPR